MLPSSTWWDLVLSGAASSHDCRPIPAAHSLKTLYPAALCCTLVAGSAHRMFLISSKAIWPAGAEGGRAQEFAVLGATGNGESSLLRTAHAHMG